MQIWGEIVRERKKNELSFGFCTPKIYTFNQNIKKRFNHCKNAGLLSVHTSKELKTRKPTFAEPPCSDVGHLGLVENTVLW
jgi:hypothetical protein